MTVAADLARLVNRVSCDTLPPVALERAAMMISGVMPSWLMIASASAGKGAMPMPPATRIWRLKLLSSGKGLPSDLPGVPAILDAAGVTELPRARIAVLDGIKSSPNQPVTRGKLTVCTLWGDLAWQLGGEEGFAMVAEADASGTSPGKAVPQTLVMRYAQSVILIAALVEYDG